MKTSSTDTIGLDLGDRYSQVCVLNCEGRVTKSVKIRTNGAGIRRFFGKRASTRVVIEVGSQSPWVSQMLTGLGHETLVANPRRVKLISAGHRKSDQLDAELLARLGRVDPQLLAPITHRSEKSRRHLTVIRGRDELVATRTSLVNHVRGLLKSFGNRLPSCNTPAFPKRARAHVAEFKPSLVATLEPTLLVLETLNQQIKELERQITELARNAYPETQQLECVDGIGTLTALTFILTLEDKNRFVRSRDVGAYVGLCPKRSQSGDKDPELRISKRGDKHVRQLLVIAAQRTLGPFGKDSDLRSWGLELAARGKKNAKKKAVVAVARRLAVLLHRLWVTGEEYQPIGYSCRARAA